MIERLRRLFLNAGLSDEEYSSIQPRLLSENYKILQIYLRLMCLAFSVLTVAACFLDTFARKNVFIYFLCVLVAFFMWLFYKESRLENSMLGMRSGIYSLMTIIYGFSIYITYLHYDKPAVTTIIFLVLLPIFFTDRPINILLVNAIGDLCFCVLTYLVKEPSLAQIDIWNGISFGFLGIVAGFITMQVKFRSFYQTEKIIYLSQTDILTGTKNRNYYEKVLEQLKKEECPQISCIYVDVNALHECNNLYGHEAGDQMLQYVSHKMMEVFCKELTFRIGGDEFVAFVRDWSSSEVAEKIQWIEEECRKMDYSISAGFSDTCMRESIDEMIQDAEQKMYQEKRKYYSDSEKNHRRTSWMD